LHPVLEHNIAPSITNYLLPITAALYTLLSPLQTSLFIFSKVLQSQRRGNLKNPKAHWFVSPQLLETKADSKGWGCWESFYQIRAKKRGKRLFLLNILQNPVVTTIDLIRPKILKSTYYGH
jgi:hypothetical protein